VKRSKGSESDIAGKNVNISATPTSNNSHEIVTPPSSLRRKLSSARNLYEEFCDESVDEVPIESLGTRHEE
jgi:hypothetical protein